MIVDYDYLPIIRKENKWNKIVLAGGCFDIVHEGHVRGLEYCKAQGDLLVVGVSTDIRIKERKGPERPIRHEIGRLTLVDALKPVDYTFLLPPFTDNGKSPTIRAIETLQPDIFADHIENQDRWEPSRESIRDLGCLLVYNTTERPDSSTAIINKIKGLSG